MPPQTQEPPRVVPAQRAGSRWLHAAPSEQEVREWFETQNLHPGMQHAPYVSGIVLIGAEEKVNVTLRRQSGAQYVEKVEQAVFVPYVKVDTRIAYFRDYVRLLNAVELQVSEGESLTLPQEFGDYYGVIRPVPQTIIADEGSAYFNANLPAGFAVYPVRESDSKISRYLVATYEAAIFKRGGGDKPDQVVVRGQGSKQTAMKRNYPDDNAIMKAETGAVGRALGVLGMLVVGTGVATAEDVQEAIAAPTGGASGATTATLPAMARSDVTTEAMIAEMKPPPMDAPDALGGEELGSALSLPDDNDGLRKLALDLRREMESKFPDAWAAYTTWWNERGFAPLNELEGPSLRGAVIKLQRDLDICTQAT